MNRTTHWLRLIGASLALFAGPALHAQTLDTGAIKGRVTDEKGQPLPGAVVKAKGPQGTKGAEADSNGNYTIPFLNPGTYELTVTMDGFSTIVQGGVTVAPLSSAVQPFKLQAGGEVITVPASRVRIDLTSTTQKTTVNLGDAVGTFAQGSNLTDSFDFAPGTNTYSGITGNGNVSISGATGFENQYLIGGVNITNGGYGAMGSYDRFSGVFGSGMTTDFLGDLTIREGGFDAEYGQALGGVISASVLSGSNDYSGAVTAYYSPRALNGSRRRLSAYYAGGQIDDRGTDRTNIAFHFSGPILRDKLFFFVGYNPVWVRASSEFTVTDTATVANDGIIGGAPYYNREYSYATTRYDNYTLHLNWNLSDKHKLDFLLFGSPQSSDGIQNAVGRYVGTAQNPGVAIGSGPGTIPSISATTAASGKTKGSDLAYSIKYFGTPATWLNIEAQISYHKFTSSLEPAYKGISYNDIRRTQLDPVRRGVMSSNNYLMGSNFGYSTGTVDKNTSYTLKVTHNFSGAGSHELKYGFEFADTRYAEPTQFAPPITMLDRLGRPVTINSGLGGVTMRCEVPTGVGGVAGVNPSATGINDVCRRPTAPFTDYTRYRSVRTRLNPLGLETKNQETSFFIQDKWTIKNVVLSLGSRWVREKVGNPNDFSVRRPGAANPTTYYGQTYTFPTEQAWRLGVTWDILGNGKSKVYAAYGKMFERIPNDLAVRSFGNELSVPRLTSTVPDFSSLTTGSVPSGGGIYSPTCVAGTTLDPVRDYNNYRTFGAICGGPGTAKTKLPYKDEFLLGYEFQVSPTVLFKLAGLYRKQGRLLEDTQPVTVEATENYYAYLGYLGTCTTAGCPANPGNPFPGFGTAPFGGYVLANVGENAPSSFTDIYGVKYGVNYGNPTHKYKSVAASFTKQRSGEDDHISAEVTYRISKLRGNYEGLYRNDNGQSDPNITSLYDFPSSPLLAGQFIDGPLNTDVPHSLRARIGYADLFIKNFSAAVTFKWESGIPRTPYLAHPNFAYNNAGEVPGQNPTYFPYSGGQIVRSYTPVQRGYQGRTPDTASWDLKLGYRWNLGKSALDFSILGENIFNETQVIRWNQNVELSAGVNNPNYGRPTAFQGYRTIRLGAKWSF